MRATSTFFTALMATAAIVPALAAPHRLNARAKVCPATDGLGGTLTNQGISSEGTLDCSYSEAGDCQYFLGNGNFSSGSSNCPKAGVDPGSPSAGNLGSGGAPSSAPTPAPVPTPDPAPAPAPASSAPAPPPAPAQDSTQPPPVAAPYPSIIPPTTPTAAVKPKASNSTSATPNQGNSAANSAASVAGRPASVVIAGVSILLGAFIMA